MVSGKLASIFITAYSGKEELKEVIYPPTTTVIASPGELEITKTLCSFIFPKSFPHKTSV